MLFLILFTLYQTTLTMLVAKVLMEKISINMKDCLLAIFTSLVAGGLFHYVLDIWFLVPPLLIVLAVFYVYKLHHYTFKKAVIISTTATTVIVLFDYVVSLTISIITGVPVTANPITIYYVIVHTLVTVLFAILLIKTTKKIRNAISENEKTQTLLIALSISIILSVLIPDMLFITTDATITFLGLNFMFLVIYFLIAVTIFYFYSKTLRGKYELQRDKDEQRIIQQYTEEIERQFKEVRKFKHDTQNILSSLDSFINDNDFEGLKNYYSDKIKPATKLTLKNNFRLEQLSNIKISEVKSIFAVKLMMAQERGIDATFESTKVITDISIDSIILVRTLGVLLDNAIEELVELKDGKLLTAILQNNKETTIIIQNTCRDNMPKVHELKQVGFSTKGTKRGLGLSNLEDFTKKNLNMSIMTQIVDNQFIQKIIIREIKT